MRTRSARALAFAFLCACGGSPSPAAAPPPPSAPPPAPATAAAPSSSSTPASPHARFADFTARFLRGYLERSPTDATSLGDHSFDDRWPDLSAEGDAANVRFIEATRAELATFKLAELDPEDRTDASILAGRLDEQRFQLTEIRDPERSAMTYSSLLGDGLDPLITREFAPIEARMTSLRGRLLGIPTIVAVARKRLGRPSQISTATAIGQVEGLLGLLEGTELTETFAKVPAQRADLEAARKVAATAVHDFHEFLKKDLLPRSDGSFRVGKETFAKILRFSFDDAIDPDTLAADARATMKETRVKMLETALELWPTLMKRPAPKTGTDAEKGAAIKAVLDKLAEDRPDDQTIVPEARKLMTEETAFVRAHDLVGVPDQPCDVIEMPEYKRGFAVAYCDASGPLEKHPQTVLAISPPPASWPPARRLSQYREYNRSMLAELIVHEGMPGHYLQQMHANQLKSDVRTVFRDGSFIEGWAVYSEWLMAKNGFGGPKVRMQQLKMLLRVATNAVLDHAVHTGSIEEKDALALMMNEGFQEEGEAVGKWRRARLSKGQLSTYFYGFRGLLALRQEMEKKPGFAERAYNDRLLSFGAPSIRVVRERMTAP